MKVTEVQIQLARNEPGQDSRLLAYARVVFDGELAVYNLKVIENDRRLFLAMTSRPRSEPCSRCRTKVPLTHDYCGRCGEQQEPGRAGDKRLFEDVVHPISKPFREYLEREVFDAYHWALREQRVVGVSQATEGA